ncbi:MAG TPA: alpha/beta hydrolase [Acidimicrobiales bacterium]|nr:alpha/beta hydrolase [Acidimicrobiales bacterium]
MSAWTWSLDSGSATVEAGQANAPSRWLYLTEPARGALQLNTIPLALPWLLRAPRGDRHGVLVLPGLLATDTSTQPLRGFLRGLGYRVKGWRLGRNLGPTQAVIDGMRRAVRELASSTGAPVSVVGWSLGGIYARELARESPSLVRRVVTLGSPFALTDSDHGPAHRAYKRRAYLHSLGIPSRVQAAAPIPVPSTAVFSRMDGIVSWRSCIEPESTLHENIEVRCAHLGFGVDPATLWVVADRLAQPEGSHRPFGPPAWLRWIYPSGR